MNITSYNVTDVAYHYIGLRVLDGMGTSAERSQQVEAISTNVRKFVSDRALRLMLPEPRGTFQTVGEKICQELVHFGLARSGRGSPYELNFLGRMALDLLAEQRYVELREEMVGLHLKTYDNLRAIVQAHMDAGGDLAAGCDFRSSRTAGLFAGTARTYFRTRRAGNISRNP